MTEPLDPTYTKAVYRRSFGSAPPTVQKFAPGLTLSQMVETFYCLPPDFAMRGTITIAGHEIERKFWTKTKIKPGHDASFHYPLAGGGGTSGAKKSKGILSLVIGIATILTAGIAAIGSFGLLGASFAGGTLGARLLSGAITVIGALASSAISAPPTANNAPKQQGALAGPASLAGNLIEAGAAIPRVIGTRKIFPSLLTQPFTYRVGNDEIVEAVFGLAGAHAATDIKVGDTSIADTQDIIYQLRNGFDDDAPIDLVTQYAVTKQPGIEITGHDVQPDEQDTLVNQGRPTASLPVQTAQGAANTPDRILLDLTFPQGLFDNTDASRRMSVPIRISMKNQATGIVYNLPELHYSSLIAGEIRPTIELNWRAQTSPIPTSMPQKEGFTFAIVSVPAQASPAMGGWAADPSFYGGAGPTFMVSGNEGTTGVDRFYADGQKAYIELDATAIPKGKYQIQIIRGCAFTKNSFSQDSSYTYSGTVQDFFGYVIDGSGVNKVLVSRENLTDQLAFVRMSSVFSQHPIAGGAAGCGLFLIAVQATNRQIDNLSLKASGYVKDWDGTGWNTLTTSSNPATNFYDVLRGPLTPDPLDLILVDNASMVTWRQGCIDNGYTCDMVCEGDQLASVLQRLAGCGYARPRQSETWGVIRDYDRSSEDPEQIFTSRNSFDVSMSNAFTRLPDAFRVIWLDKADDDNAGEIMVYRPGYENTINPRIEEVTYDGISTQAAAQARAVFDLSQASMRAAEFTFNAQAEAIKVTRGSLIAVNHDFISDLNASARIEDVEISGGYITAISVDAEMPIWIEDDMLDTADMLAVDDMLKVGAKTSVCIRRADGLISTHDVAGASGDRKRLEFVTPFTADLDGHGDPLVRYGNLACVGQSGSEYMRLIITGITYDTNMTAQITAVAEAPELWA